MITRRGFSDVVRIGLALLLLATAATKLVAASAPSPVADARALATWAAATVEITAAVLLALRGFAPYGATLVACGFMGAAIPRLPPLLAGGTGPCCRCLGAVELSNGQALLMQGLLIVMAGIVLAANEPASA